MHQLHTCTPSIMNPRPDQNILTYSISQEVLNMIPNTTCKVRIFNGMAGLEITAGHWPISSQKAYKDNPKFTLA